MDTPTSATKDSNIYEGNFFVARRGDYSFYFSLDINPLDPQGKWSFYYWDYAQSHRTFFHDYNDAVKNIESLRASLEKKGFSVESHDKNTLPSQSHFTQPTLQQDRATKTVPENEGLNSFENQNQTLALNNGDRSRNITPESQSSNKIPATNSLGEKLLPDAGQRSNLLEPETSDVASRIGKAEEIRTSWLTESWFLGEPKGVDILNALTSNGVPLSKQPQKIKDYWDNYIDPSGFEKRLYVTSGVVAGAGASLGVGIAAFEAGLVGAATETMATNLLRVHAKYTRLYEFLSDVAFGMAEMPIPVGPALAGATTATTGALGTGAHYSDEIAAVIRGLANSMMAKGNAARSAYNQVYPFFAMDRLSGYHRHHLFLKTFFNNALSPRLRAMSDLIPSVYLRSHSHIGSDSLHSHLNAWLRALGYPVRGYWYTKKEVKEALQIVIEFYRRELPHDGYAEELERFLLVLEQEGLL